MTGRHRRNLRNGLLFALPWLMGMSVFLLYPLLFAIGVSFCDYSTLEPPAWTGTENYRDLLHDDLMYKSMGNTLMYSAMAVPGTLLLGLAMALLLNTRVRGIGLFRTLFYLPCLIPAVAGTMIWLFVFNAEYGILNNGLSHFLNPINGIVNLLFALIGSSTRVHWAPPAWLSDPMWSKPALAMMAMWSAGTTMIVYLAGLQDVPAELYEAAEIDGAGWWRKLWHVTLPSLYPVIVFTLIVGLIGALQAFTPAYIIGGGPSGGTLGAPARSTLFYTLYLWAQAFDWLRMGYACALALVLFVVIVVLTLAAHRAAARRHTYLS
jgi:multiple sugar transport system permease protein